MSNNNNVVDDVKRLRAEIDQLPVEQKIRLVQDILKTSGLQVVMGGGNFISAEVVLQIQNGSAEQITEVLRALASRVSDENRDEKRQL